MTKDDSRYSKLIEGVFLENYKKGAREATFQREDLVKTATKLGVALPKNLGDIVYSFRYRTSLPKSIRDLAPAGLEWIIRPIGPGKYQFSLTAMPRVLPNLLMAEIKIPDATPGIIAKYIVNDEQGLLTKLRYNRVIDIFSGMACYSLQNHLRTAVPDIGQVETDEIYVGIDKRGAQYVFPVQAKGRTDQIGIVQIEQDFVMCATKFPQLVCCPIAAQFVEDDLIALFAFETGEEGIALGDEKHYRLVPSEKMTDQDLASYREATTDAV